MRRAASISAIIVFFGMAIIGSVCGTPPFTCGIRAIVGAAITYLLMRVAGRIIVAMLVDAIVGAPPQTSEEKDRPHERSGS
jgi:hypothetical protein